MVATFSFFEQTRQNMIVQNSVYRALPQNYKMKVGTALRDNSKQTANKPTNAAQKSKVEATTNAHKLQSKSTQSTGSATKTQQVNGTRQTAKTQQASSVTKAQQAPKTQAEKVGSTQVDRTKAAVKQTSFIAYLGPTGLLVMQKDLIMFATQLGMTFHEYLRDLVLRCEQKIGPDKVLLCYERVTVGGYTMLRLPRTHLDHLVGSGWRLAPNWPQRIAKHTEHTTDWSFHGTLESDQQVCVDRLAAQYTDESKRATNEGIARYFVYPAGRGKSVIACALLSAVGLHRGNLRAVFVVPKKPLATQILETARRHLPGASSCILTRAAAENNELADICVIVINTAIALSPAIYAQFDFAIFDEAHMYCSDKRSRIFGLACCHSVMGMSATPEGRADGFDKLAQLELACGGLLHGMDWLPRQTEPDPFKKIVRMIRYFGPDEFTANLTHDSTGKIFTHYMHHQYLADKCRLECIVDEIIALYDWRGPAGQTHNIYLFAEEIALLEIARDALLTALEQRKRGDIVCELDTPQIGAKDTNDATNTSSTNDTSATNEDSEDGPSGSLDIGSAAKTRQVGMFIGGLKDAVVAQTSHESRVLLTTYGYGGTGISIDKMTCIVFITPRKANMVQILGRILRRKSDTTIPRIVVDIIDCKTALQYQAKKREEAYDHYGFRRIYKRIVVEDPEAFE
jgi:hypothetical protein